jgi:hypothetical protein
MSFDIFDPPKSVALLFDFYFWRDIARNALTAWHRRPVLDATSEASL